VKQEQMKVGEEDLKIGNSETEAIQENEIKVQVTL
jgi:hypothetical protein